jgi:hypothetical protein
MSVVLTHDDRTAGLANRAARRARNARAEIAIAFSYGAALRDPRNCLHTTKQDRSAEYAL